MRFVVDQPIRYRVAEWLRERGHDAFHVRERGMSSASDVHILTVATTEDRVIVTSDLDFSRILALSGQNRPGIILFPAGNVSDDEMLELIAFVMERVPQAEIVCSVVVVDAGIGLRIARLPLRPDLAE